MNTCNIINIRKFKKDNEILVEGFCIIHNKYYFIYNGKPNCEAAKTLINI